MPKYILNYNIKVYITVIYIQQDSLLYINIRLTTMIQDKVILFFKIVVSLLKSLKTKKKEDYIS